MSRIIDRRHWLKQGALTLAGMSISRSLLARPQVPIPNLPAGLIMLNSNENAYGPSPMARKAIMDAYLTSNRYPDDANHQLKKKLAAHWNVQPVNIGLGAGSSEIIGLACLHASRSKGHIITADPSYKVWNDQAQAFGLQSRNIPLNKDRIIDLDKMLSAINDDTRMIYICNPNNPVGTYQDTKALSAFAEEASKRTMVFIDEAYTEFAGLETLASLAIKNKNIIVAKTFSKIYGLAGARIGYAIAHPDIIKTFSSFQPWPSANLSMVSATAAIASLDDVTFVKECLEKITASKELCYNTFKQLSLEYIPSSTNFILFNIDKVKGDFAKQMETRNIYVQFREHFGGKWCRVSMGTSGEMTEFSKSLMEIAG